MNIVDLVYSVTSGPERRRRRLVPLGVAFAVALIAATIFGSLALDRAFSLGFAPSPFGISLGAVMIVAGLGVWIWCLALFKGKGVPFDPPRALVTTGPYAWVRNPMLTGWFFVLLGLAMALGSVALVVVGTPAFMALTISELKIVEEPELERRLGASYREYKARVPMFVPRLPRNHGY